MDFLEKLNTLMEKNNYNKSTLSKACGIPYTTIDGWYKRGYEELRLPTIKKLCTFFDTSLDYWIKDEITDPNYGKTENFQISYEEMKHIEKYRDLDDFGKKRIDKEIDKEIERIKSIEERDQRIQELESSQHQNKVIVYPYYRKLASAGNGDYLFDDIPLETFEVDYDFAKDRGADFALGVNGDSMEDDINDGDVVLVKKQSSVNDNELGVFIIDGNCFIKIYDNGTLISSNSKYKDIKLTEYNNIICVGKVVGIIQPERNKFDLPIENADPNDEEYKHPIYRFAAHSGLKDTPETREMTEKLAEFFKSQGKSKNNE